MASNYTSPGVYIQEVASPVHTIVGVPTSVLALVGTAERGASDLPVTISSLAEFGRTFGDFGTPLGQAATLFFQNGGAQLVVVRIVSADAATASLDIGGVTLTANAPGLWGNDIQAKVDTDGLPTDVAKTSYNLTIKSDTAGISERYVAVSKDDSSARSIGRVLLASQLVTGETTPAATDSSRKTRTGTPAASGTPAAGTEDDTGGTAPTTGTGTTASADGFQSLDGGADGKGTAPTPPDNTRLTGDPTKQTGLYALTKDGTFFNMLVVLPPAGVPDVDPSVLGTAAQIAQQQRAMLIVDAPSTMVSPAGATAALGTLNLNAYSDNVALYYPRVSIADPKGGQISGIGPAPAIAGIYARTDQNRNVWKAPAGITATFAGITGLDQKLNDADNGALNQMGINALRSWPVTGNVVWGARTLSGSDWLGSQWKYVPVRRLALFLEESLYRGTQWIVFEPNDEPLWAQIRLNVGTFMHDLFRQGAFQGTTAADAYFVKCDKDVNPQSDIDRGIVNILVGFAPLKPAEFVVIQLQQITGQLDT